MLDKDQIHYYQENGFLVLENIFSKQEMQALIDRYHTIINRHQFTEEELAFFSTKDNDLIFSQQYFIDSADKISFFFEKQQSFLKEDLLSCPEKFINKIGHALHKLDSVFNHFSHTSLFKTISLQLGLCSPHIVQSMIISKLAQVGSEVLPHQDSTFIFMPQKDVIGFWLALDDASIKNGCLYVSPQQINTSKLYSRYLCDEDKQYHLNSFQEVNYDELTWQPLEVSAGSLVILHGKTFHKSEANFSSNSRLAYAMHVIDGNINYPSENWLQSESFDPL